MGMFRTVVLVGLALTAGCYRWVPTDQPVPPGTAVRMQLTTEGSDAVRSVFGPNNGIVEGPLATWTDDEIGLLLRSSISRPGFPPTTIQDTVSVASNQVRVIEIKELNGKKTAWMSAGIVAGIAGMVILTRTFGGENETGDPELPPPDDAVVFSIPLRLFGG